MIRNNYKEVEGGAEESCENKDDATEQNAEQNGEAVKIMTTNSNDSFAYNFELSRFNRTEREHCEGD